MCTYNAVGKEYEFDRGEKHDFCDAKKHLEVQALKLKKVEKSLNKLEAEIKMKEQSLSEQAKDLEPEEHISIYNTKKVLEKQKSLILIVSLASLLSTAGMPLDKIRDILGQVDEKTTLGYIYNPKLKYHE